MVPDYAMIGEIVLISAGFVEAKLLARIVGSSLQLSSEQLSSQDHYDFGMRALESILVRAGALRRLDGCSRSEMVLALSALNDVNLAKFNSNGFPLLSRHHRGPLSLRGAAPPSDYGWLIRELGGLRLWHAPAAQGGVRPQVHPALGDHRVRHGLTLVGQTVSADQLVRLILHRAGLAGQLLLCRLESDQDSSITEAETTR